MSSGNHSQQITRVTATVQHAGESIHATETTYVCDSYVRKKLFTNTYVGLPGAFMHVIFDTLR